MNDIDQLNRKIASLMILIDSKDDLIVKCQSKIERLIMVCDKGHVDQLNKINDDLRKSLGSNSEFDLMKLHFEEVHPNFYDELLKHSSLLTAKDLRLAAFLRMSLNNKEIAYLLNISHAGIKKAIQRLRKKLNLGPKDDLRKFIITI